MIRQGSAYSLSGPGRSSPAIRGFLSRPRGLRLFKAMAIVALLLWPAGTGLSAGDADRDAVITEAVDDRPFDSVAITTGSDPSSDSGPWSQWRGPLRNGKLPAGEPWPADFTGLSPVWKVDNLGPSYSGPIIGPDRVFITETRDKKYEVVSAYDRWTGKLLWSRQWQGAIKVPFFASRNGSWIRSTPAYDGETLYVGGIREVLVALDGATGAQRWKIDFPALAAQTNPPFGFVCSPLVEKEHVYVEAAGSLFKIRKADGEVTWRTKPFSGGSMTSDGTFSSPVMATLAGHRQLLVQSRQELLGIDPENGSLLWRQAVPSFRGMNILTPTVWNDSIFTSTYKNASFRFDVAAIDGRPMEVTEVWQNNAQAYMSSPVEIDGVAYTHLGNGRLTAVDLTSGERLWTSKPFGPYWSMVAQGHRILALDSQGELILLQVSRRGFEIVDRHQVSERETWAHLAAADGQLVIRDLNGLTLWRWQGSPTATRRADRETAP